MQIRFNANLETGEAQISPATLRDLAEMTPLMRADLLKDVVYHAQEAYQRALGAMGTEWALARQMR